MEILEYGEKLLHIVAEGGAILFELIGVGILIWTCVTSLVKIRSHGTGLYLGHGLAMALEFLMGGESLHTVLAKSLQDISTVAGILALRAALSILLHWEMKQEKAEEKEEEEKLHKGE